MTVRAGSSNIRMLTQSTLQSIQGTHVSAVMKHGFGKSLLNPQMPDVEKLAALGEEFGEVCRLLTYDHQTGPLDDRRMALVKELLQLSASAAAWAESVDTPQTIIREEGLEDAP